MEGLDEKEILRIVSRNVESLPIYGEEQRVEARVDWDGNNAWAIYEADPYVDPLVGSGFHLRFSGKVCELETIGLAEELRGQGIGERMYVTVENIARELGCERIEQMPSEFTATGESRRNYLKRKLGYTDFEDGGKVGKDLD